MYYIKIKTRFNLIELILEDNNFYDENFQYLLQQPYVSEVFLRWIDEKEYQVNPQYNKLKKLERKKKNNE